MREKAARVLQRCNSELALFTIKKSGKKYTEMQTRQEEKFPISFFVWFFLLCVKGMEELWLKFFTKMSSK